MAGTLGRMRLLIIDNGTEGLKNLQAVLAKHEITVTTPDALDVSAVGDYDGIIISGDYQQGLVWERPYFLAEVELLRLSDKPVLGICQGFELLCYAYGSQLHELTEQVSGAEVVLPTTDGSKLFQGTDPVRVIERRSWAVDEIPKDLTILANSDTGIEAIRHKTRPLYGLQLRPEDFKYGSDGAMVFANILDNFRKNQTV